MLQGTAVTKLCDVLLCVLDQTLLGVPGHPYRMLPGATKPRSEGPLVAERSPSGIPRCSRSPRRWTPRTDFKDNHS